jgi:hypothetical protein
MDYATWQQLTPAQRIEQADLSDLSPQLISWKGWRVEVVTSYGETRRFIVGQSTGWKPCHLEIKTRRSMGGMAADKEYKSVRPLYIAR